VKDSETKRAALLVAVMGSFVTPVMGSSVNVALPAIGEAFHLDAVLLSWIATSYLLAAAVFLVPLGKIGDIHGRKKIYAWGTVLFAAASLVAALSVSSVMLICCRVLQGVGAAMIFSTGMAILTSVFPPSERGRALGINVAAVYIGLSLGPFIGGFLTQHFSWRAVFFFNVPLGVATVAVLILKLKGEWSEARGEKFDYVGSVVYGMSLVSLMYGVATVPSPQAPFLMAVGVVGIALFTVWELRIGYPVFDLSLFRENRVFAFSSVAALLNYSATFAVTFLMSLYLQHVKGFSPQGAGLVLIAQPAVMALGSPFAGRLSDRIEPRIVASVGMSLTSLGLLCLSSVGEETHLAFIVGSLLVVGLGFALFSSPNANAIMSSVPRRLYGIASGSVGTMRLLGQMFSMGITSLTFALFIGRIPISEASHTSFLTSLRIAFIVFAVLCAGGIVASLARGELRPLPGNPEPRSVNGQSDDRS
jgi:EmrB/QacA subfamily drug resistance transporter